jgi:hypothetical protein
LKISRRILPKKKIISRRILPKKIKKIKKISRRTMVGKRVGEEE